MVGRAVEEELDIQSSLQHTWAVSFSLLYLLVMLLSTLLYLAVVRALARTATSSVTHHLVLLLFLAALVEFAVELRELLARFGYFLLTDAACGFF